MSLTDKVIKNTLYSFIPQIATFISPLLLTPFIIGKIGEENFGIYAIILGLTGTIGLIDFSISTSFVNFISKYYNQKKFSELNSVINTGIFFYVSLSVLVMTTGFVFSGQVMSLIRIPDHLFDGSITAFRISLLTFFVSNTFIIFTSVLISIQKMYIISIITVISTFVNIFFTLIFLYSGFGLEGLMWSQFITVSILSLTPLYHAFLYLPDIKIGIKYLKKKTFREIGKFGAQMQMSRLSTFASEKLDEILLGIFSSLSNVTYYNLSIKISRFGRFIPMQVVNQVAPVAAELSSKGQEEKLNGLFKDISKYLTLVSLPLVVFVFIFADLIFIAWIGNNQTVAVHITRILMLGQAVNLMFSAPGNSITPNIGLPKYQMFEGLIHFGVNLILSFILILKFGVLGAAYGNAVATITSSLYVFYVSSRYFKTSLKSIISETYFKPTVSVIISSVLSYFLYNIILLNFIQPINRINSIYLLLITTLFYNLIFFLIILFLKYLNEKDKELIFRAVSKFIPQKILSKYKPSLSYKYNNELVSFFIVTHNRVKMLEKCTEALLKSIKDLNYEIIIWDNASSDGTKEYLNKLCETDNRIRVVFNNTNSGTNGKGCAAEECKGDYIFGIDDDVLDFPENWANEMINAYNCIPFMGYLATDVIQNEHTNGAKPGPEFYRIEKYCDGTYTLLVGPTGGWCFLISRKVYNEVGKFLMLNDRVFFFEDGDYGVRAIGRGLKVGILEGIKVFHATGDYYNKEYEMVLRNKYKSAKLDLPTGYKIMRKLKCVFSIKKFIRKTIDASTKSER